MIDIDKLRQALGAVQPEEVEELLGRLEAAESALSNLGVTPDEARDGLARHKALIARLEAAESEALEEARLNGMGSEREAALMAKLEKVEKERDALRGKIEQMEKQEPVGTVQWVNGWPVVNAYEDVILEPNKPLYALPGAKGE